jgi:hypothetical protein
MVIFFINLKYAALGYDQNYLYKDEADQEEIEKMNAFNRESAIDERMQKYENLSNHFNNSIEKFKELAYVKLQMN